MKPAYEIVRADELQPGDVVLDLRGGAVEPYVIDSEFVEIARGSPKNFYPPKIRQLPPERNPDVLMRALRGVVGFVGFLDQDVDFVCSTWINTAIRELESEAGDGVQD